MFEHGLFYDWVQVFLGLKKLLQKYNESYLHYILLLPNMQMLYWHVWKCSSYSTRKKLKWSNRFALLKKPTATNND